MFIFLCVTIQAKVFTLDDTLDFHRNSAIEKGTTSIGLDQDRKNEFTKNKLEKDNNQVIVFGMDGDKCTLIRENISLSRSSVSKSLRLQ